MKNFKAEGRTITLIAAAAILSGQLVAVGAIVGCAVTDAAVGDEVTLNLTGVYEVAKPAATAISQGAKLYLLADGSGITTTATSNTFLGYAYKAAASADATIEVLLAQ